MPAKAAPVVAPPAAGATQGAAATASSANAATPKTTTDAAKAKALLEGKPAVPAGKDGSRFVVQVGAFADAAAAQDMRERIDKLGLKSYTQATDTPSGQRIRVRLGPFGSREEAERVLAKAKAGGVSGVVLTL